MTITVLIADDEPAARRGMTKALAKLDCRVIEADDGKSTLEAIACDDPGLVFLDLNMPGLGGCGVLEALGDKAQAREIVVVTANDTIDAAVNCMRLGAADYITKPFEVEQLRGIARRNIERVRLQQRVIELSAHLDEKTALGSLVGVSRSMRRLFAQMEKAAQAPMDVLIVGETGTGKELIAREIHRLCARGGPFVAMNTSAVTPSLAESELFGHGRGAFTGATEDRKGVFERAHGGTLFLDEIGDMPLELQPKLLRVLQERTLEPLGKSASIKIDIRVVSATHQDLQMAVEEGHFRQDLFYRVRGIVLEVPPLRSRQEDIILLAEYFLDRWATESRRDAPELGVDAKELLLAHSWPGNVRELEQVVTAAASMAPGSVLTGEDLAIAKKAASADTDVGRFFGLPLTEGKTRLVAWYEQRAIEAALTEEMGNVSATARRLGVHRQSLQQKMLQLGINRR